MGDDTPLAVETLRDIVAICQFLADKHGKLTYPAGSLARAKQDSFTQFAMDDVESPDIYFFTTPELAETIKQEMRAYFDELGY